MPRPRKADPAYQYQTSGQAVVQLNYRDDYLGPHSSPDSYARYYALLATYNANGRQMPEEAATLTHQVDEPITVRCVTADYRHRVLPGQATHRSFFGSPIC